MILYQTVYDVILESGDADAVARRQGFEQLTRRLAETADHAHGPGRDIVLEEAALAESPEIGLDQVARIAGHPGPLQDPGRERAQIGGRRRTLVDFPYHGRVIDLKRGGKLIGERLRVQALQEIGHEEPSQGGTAAFIAQDEA